MTEPSMLKLIDTLSKKNSEKGIICTPYVKTGEQIAKRSVICTLFLHTLYTLTLGVRPMHMGWVPHAWVSHQIRVCVQSVYKYH